MKFLPLTMVLLFVSATLATVVAQPIAEETAESIWGAANTAASTVAENGTEAGGAISDVAVDATELCGVHGALGADDPVFFAMCRLGDALRSNSLFNVSLATHDDDNDRFSEDPTPEINRDRDDDERPDLAQVAWADDTVQDEGDVAFYLQLDYFYTPEGSNEEPYAFADLPFASGETFDIPLDSRIMLYAPHTGAEQSQADAERGVYRLTNDFRDSIEIALYQANGNDRGPGAGDDFDIGRCIVCLDLEKNIYILDETVDGRGLIDFDLTPGIGVPGDSDYVCFSQECSEDSIQENLDLDGDGESPVTATWIYISLGWTAQQEFLNDYREDSRGRFADRAGVDLGVMHVKWPQWEDESVPDFARFATKYSNIDNDDNTDAEESLCDGSNPSNPTNPFSDCDDMDGDGVKNDDEQPGQELNPLVLIVDPIKGSAPLNVSIEYACPTDQAYTLRLGDIDHSGSSTTLRSSSGSIQCGAGKQSLLIEDANPLYLNGDAQQRDVQVSLGGSSGSAAVVTIEIEGSVPPPATLTVADDNEAGEVTPTITYMCDAPAGAGIASAVLDLGKLKGGEEATVLSLAEGSLVCDGYSKVLDNYVFGHVDSKRGENRTADISLVVVSTAHPDIKAEEEAQVIVGGFEAPTLSLTVPMESGEAPFEPTGEIEYTCAPGTGDTISGASIDFGYTDLDGDAQSIGVSCDNPQPVSFPAAFLNDEGSVRDVKVTLSVKTDIAGGPYTISDTGSIQVLGNAVEPGTFTVECVSDNCPSSSTVLNSDPTPGQPDEYELLFKFVPGESDEDHTITYVEFQIYASGKTTIKQEGVYDANEEAYTATYTVTPGDAAYSRDARVSVSDDGGRTAFGPVAFDLKFPRDVMANFVPEIDSHNLAESANTIDGASVPVDVSVRAHDEGGEGRVNDENDPLTIWIHYWPVNAPDDAESAPVRIVDECTESTIGVEPAEQPDPTSCTETDFNDGKTQNGEDYATQILLQPGRAYEYYFKVTDGEATVLEPSDPDSVHEFANDGEQSTILAATGSALENATATAMDAAEAVQKAIEETPTTLCGEGNEDDVQACIAHIIGEICGDEAAAEDPTTCQSNTVEAITEFLISAVEPVVCTFGGELAGDCADRVLENATRTAQELFDATVCEVDELAGNLLGPCGGGLGNAPGPDDVFIPNPLDLLMGRCDPGVNGTSVIYPDDCRGSSIASPLSDFDGNDKHDADGNGERNEANGQLDLVEERLLFLNPDELGTDEEEDLFDGSTGFTVTVYHFSGFTEPVPAYVIRMGDVSGTPENERLVIQQYDEFGSPTQVDCIFSTAQANTSTPALFHWGAESTHFRSGAYCGDPQESSALRVAQANLMNDGYQGMMVWADDDNNGVRDHAPDAANGKNKSNEDILGFYLAPAEGVGMDVGITIHSLQFFMNFTLDPIGDIHYHAQLVNYADGSSLNDDDDVDESTGTGRSQGHYNATEPYNSTVVGSGTLSAVNEHFQDYSPDALSNQTAGPVETETWDADHNGNPENVTVVVDGEVVVDNEEWPVPDADPAFAAIQAALQAAARQDPSIPMFFGPIDEEGDGAPEGVWVDQDGDGERAGDGSEDTYFDDADPETLAELADQVVTQVSEEAEGQVQAATDAVAPPCEEAEEGMPCQTDDERNSLRSMLGLPPDSPIHVKIGPLDVWI